VRSYDRTADHAGPVQSLLDRLEPGGAYSVSVWARLRNDSGPHTIKTTMRRSDGSGIHYDRIATAEVTDSAWTLLEGTWIFEAKLPIESLSFYVEGPPPPGGGVLRRRRSRQRLLSSSKRQRGRGRLLHRAEGDSICRLAHRPLVGGQHLRLEPPSAPTAPASAPAESSPAFTASATAGSTAMPSARRRYRSSVRTDRTSACRTISTRVSKPIAWYRRSRARDERGLADRHSPTD